MSQSLSATTSEQRTQAAVSSISLSLQLMSIAPHALAQFLSVILDCDVDDRCSLSIAGTSLHFSEGIGPSGNLIFAFNGYTKIDIESFYQRANFYHFRERQNLPSQLTFHLPQLEDKGEALSLTWRDWNGWLWTFHSQS